MSEIEITGLPSTTSVSGDDYLHTADQSGQQFKVPVSYINSSEAIKYDPTLSGLTATTVQGAIDEIATIGLPEGSGGVLYFTKTAPVTATVGPTGDFETLEEALAFYAMHRGLDPLNPAPGFGVLSLDRYAVHNQNTATLTGSDYLVTILLQDNYAWQSQILLYGGVDLSHIVVKMADDTKYTPASGSITSGALFTCTEGSRSPLFLNKINMGAVQNTVTAFKAVGNGSTLEFSFSDGVAPLKYGCHVINCSGVGVELHSGAYSLGGFFFTGGTYLKSYNSQALAFFGKSSRCSCVVDASASKIVFNLHLELGVGSTSNPGTKGGIGNFIADPGVDSLGLPLSKNAVVLNSGSEMVVRSLKDSALFGQTTSALSANPNLRYLFRGFQTAFKLRGGSSVFVEGTSCAVASTGSITYSLRIEGLSGTVLDISEASRFAIVGVGGTVAGSSLCFKQGDGSLGFAVLLDGNSTFIASPRIVYSNGVISDSNGQSNILAVPLYSTVNEPVSGTALFEISSTSLGIISSNNMSRACFENTSSSFAASVSNRVAHVSGGGVVTFATTLAAGALNTSQAKNVWTVNGIVSDA